MELQVSPVPLTIGVSVTKNSARNLTYMRAISKIFEDLWSRSRLWLRARVKQSTNKN